MVDNIDNIDKVDIYLKDRFKEIDFFFAVCIEYYQHWGNLIY